MKYEQRYDGEGFTVASGQKTRWACCDCGAVHDLAFVIDGDEIGVAASRNTRATAARRRTSPPLITRIRLAEQRVKACAKEWHKSAKSLEALSAIARDVVAFLEEESENRASAGSDHSDYEREPRELAERLLAALNETAHAERSSELLIVERSEAIAAEERQRDRETSIVRQGMERLAQVEAENARLRSEPPERGDELWREEP